MTLCPSTSRSPRIAGVFAFIGAVVLQAVCTTVHPESPQGSVTVESQPLNLDTRPCIDAFESHRLTHVTQGTAPGVGLFFGNGSGVALADLDADGLIDIVLPGLHAPTTLLWNEGGLQFRSETLDSTLARAVNAVDVDGDGRIDLVFTHLLGVPTFWRGSAGPNGPRFARVAEEQFHGSFKAYAIAWADLDDDSDLDMVGASYESSAGTLALARAVFRGESEEELVHRLGSDLGGGVFVLINDGGALTALRLTAKATALALILTDVDGDGRRDILVGNDFHPPDAVFLNKPEGWIDAAPFTSTTTNTMSFAEGDVDNDGIPELLATDMKPYPQDESVDNAWGPVLDMVGDMDPKDGVQIARNVLQTRTTAGAGFVERAEAAGVDATGWSWSAQFGDLDNDGFLDLYVVNGMIASELFGHLAGDELREENQALRNDGTGRFVHVPEWGLGATESGRGMAMADLDNDGDLDVVVNNLAKPAMLFENRLCGGTALEVELHWESSPNRPAIGAQLRLYTQDGTLHREMRASSGYLSSDPARVHFGLGQLTGVAGEAPYHLEVTWPDGRISRIDRPSPGTLITVERVP